MGLTTRGARWLVPIIRDDQPEVAIEHTRNTH
jgi:hypothetical protein